MKEQAAREREELGVTAQEAAFEAGVTLGSSIRGCQTSLSCSPPAQTGEEASVNTVPPLWAQRLWPAGDNVPIREPGVKLLNNLVYLRRA